MRNLSTLSSQQHAEVLRFLTKNLRGAAYMEARGRLNVAQQQLADSHKFVGQKMLGSPASMGSCRSKAFSLWAFGGTYTVFLTFNPSEVYCEGVLKYCGYPYDFKDDGNPTSDRPSTATERWQIVARNAHAIVQFLLDFEVALVEVGCGWNFKDKSPKLDSDGRRIPGLFGVVLAWFFKPEVGGREGMPHDHIDIVTAELQPSRLRHTFRVAQELFERFAAQWLPTPYHSPTAHGFPLFLPRKGFTAEESYKVSI